jgi:hypothetical protein
MEEKKMLEAILTEINVTEDSDYNKRYKIRFNYKDGGKIFNMFVRDYAEPEDNCLSRDLKFVYDIPKAIEEAYKIGLAGGKIEFEKVEIRGS